MTDPRIASIASYDERRAIREFVDRCLRSRADVCELLGAADPARLVVVKPNWIQESHEYEADVWVPVITHPVLLLEILAGLAELMGGRGTIALCDAPHTYADFPSIVARGGLAEGLDELRRAWPELRLELLDLRREVWIRKEEVVVRRLPNAEDPRGYARLDLGRDSWFFGHPGEGRYYGADYDSRVVNEHHRGEVHEYLLAGTPIACDLFVNVPKLKTHKKTGLTCSLKNLVGINGDKNWLPHHTEGSVEDGGDEFAASTAGNRVERVIKSWGRRTALAVPGVGTWAYRKMRNAGKQVLGDSEATVRNGNWHGNDTCWRMALDLNRALRYGNADGSWRPAQQARPYLAFVDGIVGGQGNGPLCPEPAASGVLLFGDNPAVVDATAARLMGYDPLIFPIVRRAFERCRWPIADRAYDTIRVHDERRDGELPLGEVATALDEPFRLHFGWRELLAPGRPAG